MTALRHVPGHVVVLSLASPFARFEESYLSAIAELLVTNRYELGDDEHPRNVGLEVYLVNVGEELHFLDYVRSQPGVMAASINYIGLGLDQADADVDATTPAQDYPELAYGAGKPARSTLECLLWPNGPAPPELLTGSDAPYIRRKLPFDRARLCFENVIVAVDVTVDHCKDVMVAMAEGYAAAFNEPRDRPCIIGMTAGVEGGGFTDVFGFGDRLLRLAEIAGPRFGDRVPVDAINMSVDFGQVMRGYAVLTSADYPVAVASIPVLEEIIELTSEILTRGVDGPRGDKVVPGRKPRTPRASPAFFAAAGNRIDLRAAPRTRMGYPAIRPEIIAATFVTAIEGGDDLVDIGEAVDVPATSALKPCFAVDLRRHKVSRPDGSSFACAWLSGYFVAVNSRDAANAAELGRFSKTAWLMQQGRPGRIAEESREGRLPNFVQVIGAPPEQQVATRSPNEADDLVEQLGRNFQADFCLYGSTATVVEWLALREKSMTDIKPVFRKDIGDIDLLYTRGLDAKELEAVREFAQNWFKQKFGRVWVQDRKRPVELHPFSGLLGVSERLRAVVPATRLHITRGGLIDVWGGSSDLRKGEIRFLAMTDPALWYENKLFSTGADCLALNILQWIGCALLLRLVSKGVGVEPPALAPESLREVGEIFKQAESSRNKNAALFGGEQPDLRERVDRRFERVETLMGSCARHGVLDSIFDDVLKHLRELRP